MKKKKSKIRQNKSYNKKSKFRRKKSKKKMIGGMQKSKAYVADQSNPHIPGTIAWRKEERRRQGLSVWQLEDSSSPPDSRVSIYDTQEDQNIELSRENERLRIQLAEADADWTSRLQRYADKLKFCEEENKRLKIQLVEAKKLQAPTNKPSRFRKSSQRDPAGAIWLGSTEEEVLSILGTPMSIDDYGGGGIGLPHVKNYNYKLDSRSYSTDRIKFENGHITSYSNNSGRLPISCGIEIIPGGKITIGSTEEEVLSILGTPMSIDDYGGGGIGLPHVKNYNYKLDSRSYSTDRIKFENGHITSYSNNSGRLPISLQTTTPSVPHAETTLEYHQSELGRMGGTSSPSISPPSTDFSEGDRVYYKNHGKEQLATILRIDRNVALGEDPYVTLKIDGHERERQTTIDHIRKVD